MWLETSRAVVIAIWCMAEFGTMTFLRQNWQVVSLALETVVLFMGMSLIFFLHRFCETWNYIHFLYQYFEKFKPAVLVYLWHKCHWVSTLLWAPSSFPVIICTLVHIVLIFFFLNCCCFMLLHHRIFFGGGMEVSEVNAFKSLWIKER